jgi:hypothetical protein
VCVTVSKAVISDSGHGVPFNSDSSASQPQASRRSIEKRYTTYELVCES